MRACYGAISSLMHVTVCDNALLPCRRNFLLVHLREKGQPGISMYQNITRSRYIIGMQRLLRFSCCSNVAAAYIRNMWYMGREQAGDSTISSLENPIYVVMRQLFPSCFTVAAIFSVAWSVQGWWFVLVKLTFLHVVSSVAG